MLEDVGAFGPHVEHIEVRMGRDLENLDLDPDQVVLLDHSTQYSSHRHVLIQAVSASYNN